MYSGGTDGNSCIRFMFRLDLFQMHALYTDTYRFFFLSFFENKPESFGFLQKKVYLARVTELYWRVLEGDNLHLSTHYLLYG